MKPKVIFLDAVGTLFGVKGNVGENYAKIASNFGVKINSENLNQAFFTTFKKAPPLAFSETEINEVSKLEYNWWKNLAQNAFQEAKELEKIPDFEAYFQELYQYFATEKPWFIYEDVIPALEYWQKNDIRLGIISNFDTRIFSVLKALKLEPYFSTITISSLTGHAKPNQQIFVKALTENDCQPSQTWHIGDSYKEDYQGALSLGIKAFFLKRPEMTLNHIINE